jgi:hypothetical protein
MAAGITATRRLTNVERRLVRCVQAGTELDLTDAGPGKGEDEKGWEADRTVRAVVIRDIIRGRLASDPDPLGLRLRGAKIEGTLDLRQVAGELPLNPESCFLPSGANLASARLSSVILRSCRIERGVSLISAHTAGTLGASGTTG